MLAACRAVIWPRGLTQSAAAVFDDDKLLDEVLAIHAPSLPGPRSSGRLIAPPIAPSASAPNHQPERQVHGV
jgi:hypothetical protein